MFHALKTTPRSSGYLALLVGVLLLTAVPLCGCRQGGSGSESQNEAPRMLEVEVVDVRPEQINSTLRLVGTLMPVQAATISSDVDGTIKSFALSDRKLEYQENGQTKSVVLPLDLGQKVRKGDVICQIDPTSYEQASQVAKANLELVKSQLADLLSWRRREEVAQIEAQVEEAKAAHARAKADLERSKKLIESKTTSQSAHDEIVMAERTAAAGVKSAEAALELAKAGPTKEQIAVAKASIEAAKAEVARHEENLRKTTILAPYDAVVSNRYVGVGTRVTATPVVDILQIVDQRALLAQVSVPEQYQGMIHLDSIAMISAAGVPQAVPGRIDLVNSIIDPETRTFRVRVTIDNRKDTFKAGGFVNVDVPIVSASGVI
ncbi:MAG: efflux RND transporter periplasmic adaptor subunit, partial [Pirellulales bacterium]|nr:efflux RND transporter periplasmic adaptor subunit [Pirellulales bacterium]